MKVRVSGRLPARFSTDLVSATVEATVHRAKKPSRGSIAVRFVTPAEIQRLNTVYRKKRKPTDVLSFSSQENVTFPSTPDGEQELGDIFVCPAVAKAEATRRSISFHEELVRLISHGTLHLLGYDHATESDERRMFGLQEDVVERLMSRV